MRIVMGLGNPLPEYAETRHNAGFRVVESLASRWGVSLRDLGRLRAGIGSVAGQPVLLVLPQTFMNRSGEAVDELPVPSWEPADLIVVHDDLDLPVGTIRVRHDGGAGGHRGVLSIMERCGCGFDRVRIGIGRPLGGEDPAAYVLQPPAAEERGPWEAALSRAADAVECLLAEGLQAAMNRFNTRSERAQQTLRSVAEPDEEERE